MLIALKKIKRCPHPHWRTTPTQNNETYETGDDFEGHRSGLARCFVGRSFVDTTPPIAHGKIAFECGVAGGVPLTLGNYVVLLGINLSMKLVNFRPAKY